jgi:hypothetical protein
MAESYTLIAPKNFMGGAFYPISQAWQDVPQYLRENPNGKHLAFDVMRMRYISEHFDHVYIDVDVNLLRPIEIGTCPMEAGPGVLAGNGDVEDGKRCWEGYLKYCPKFCRPASLRYSGLPVEPVPPDSFIHDHARGNYF